MNPALVPAVIVGGTAASYLVAGLVGVPALVPFLNVAPAFPFMIASLRRGRVAEAVWRMLVWAAALAVCATAISYLDSAKQQYRDLVAQLNDIKRSIDANSASSTTPAVQNKVSEASLKAVETKNYIARLGEQIDAILATK